MSERMGEHQSTPVHYLRPTTKHSPSLHIVGIRLRKWTTIFWELVRERDDVTTSSGGQSHHVISYNSETVGQNDSVATKQSDKAPSSDQLTSSEFVTNSNEIDPRHKQ